MGALRNRLKRLLTACWFSLGLLPHSSHWTLIFLSLSLGELQLPIILNMGNGDINNARLNDSVDSSRNIFELCRETTWI